MKKTLLTLSSLFILSGCSVFDNSKDDIAPQDIETTQPSEATQEETSMETSETETQERTAEELQSIIESEEKERTGVFNEEELDETDYPKSSLNFQALNGTYSDLDKAINDYYEAELTKEEQDKNSKEVPKADLDSLQKSLDKNELLAPLEAKVDQVMIELGGKTNYITRVVVPMTYEDSTQIKADNDILLLNEALSHVGNRLILVEYYNPDTGVLIPMHLANSSNSLFSNDTNLD